MPETYSDSDNGEGTDQETPLRLQLDSYEGPLDLLLQLVRQNEVDIYDIPIAQIADQYLEIVNQIQEQDIEVGGEFLQMAAMLIKIKSRMLVPGDVEDEDEEEEEGEDPRWELVEKLIEYQKFKEVADTLARYEGDAGELFTRFFPGEEVPPEDRFLEVGLHELLTAFRSVLDVATRQGLMEMVDEEVTVESKMEEITARLEQNESLLLDELVKNVLSRMEIVATFLALLELIRLHRLQVRQSQNRGPIRLFRVDSS